MADLTTTYLGLKLDNPLVPSSSPLSKNLDSAKRLEDAGASAIVMSSLFEEKIIAEEQHALRFFHQQAIGHAEADSFHPQFEHSMGYQEQYLAHLSDLKAALQIPVIASLNGTSQGGWLDYAHSLQQAGADALELNIYHIAADVHEDSATVENRYLDILHTVKSQLDIPITLKLGVQFSSLVHFAKRLEMAGADGLVVFNRFYQPDIDLETLQVVPKLELSTSSESLLRIRWLAMLHGRVNLSLAATGGFHQAEDVVKALLAGADVVHLCSVLLERGPEHLAVILQDLEQWLTAYDYASVAQLKGSVSQQHAIDPSVYERANYVQVLDSYSSPSGVWR